MAFTCGAIATQLAVSDLLVFERTESNDLRLLGGAGRGEGWAGSVELPLEQEPLAARGLASGMTVRIHTEPAVRVVGPYWSTDAAIVPVGDAHLVVYGADHTIRTADGELLRFAAEAVAACDDVPAAKLLADELEVVHAVRQLMDYRPTTVRDTARHVAAVAARALSCELAAVLVHSPEGNIVEVAQDAWQDGGFAPRLAAELPRLADLAAARPVLEQDVESAGGHGLVSRYTLGIGQPQPYGFLLLGHAEEHPRGFTNLCQRVGRAIADAAEVLISQAIAREQLTAERDHYAHEARVDSLTGLGNRIAWSEALTAEEQRAQRYERPVLVLTADVDRLKTTNDLFGHAAGDELLVAAGEVLRSSLRGSDILARIGGDEFGAILPETDATAVGALLVRIAAGCQAWRGSLAELRLELSVGWATRDEAGTLGDAARAADVRMYEVKRGR